MYIYRKYEGGRLVRIINQESTAPLVHKRTKIDAQPALYMS